MEKAVSPIEYSAGYKYQVRKDNKTDGICFPDTGYHECDFLALGPTSITLRNGYASDGPSWPAIDTDTFMRGAFIHDGCYQAIRMGWLPESAREYCDRLLRQICLADGMNPLRAWWVYKGLRVGGGKAADPSSVKVVLTAPT